MNDPVERDNVIKAIDKRICELQSHPTFKRKNADRDLYGLKKMIINLPSARPQGKWTPFVSEEWMSPIADFYKCSICGKRVNLFQMRSYNFCPSCGAKMKGANDE